MARIDLQSLSRVYGANKVLDNVDITAEDGEFVVLLGPSGCGKSTLLRLVAGLDNPTSGAILMDGKDVTGRAPADRDLAFVFQSYALYPHMTVRRNIAFPLLMRHFRWWHHLPVVRGRLHRLERTDEGIRSRVADVAGLLGVDELLDRYPRTLSGGQRQRVALGRALVRDPAAFLMDEPLSNLDAKLRAEMRYEIMALHQKVGKTVLYVTHDQVEAMTMGTKVILLNRGVVQQSGTPDEIYRDPANTFVAQFLGSPPMNVLPALTMVPGQRFAAYGGNIDLASFEPSESPTDALDVDEPCLLGIRPEDLVIADAHGEQGQGIPGIAILVEHVGHESTIGIKPDSSTVSAGESVRQNRILVRQVGGAIAVGAQAVVRPRPGARVSVFSAVTKQRIATGFAR